ncbi:VanZ family protein [Anaerocolumna sp. MB42-C2]|uniref:VanZ family protein n=1 Tax=Anaerocolumna sp. MB42-C2 TaxID=3070997 RepID=UPI0027E1A8E7|nr:VanZ family protein [Anaerocolumna sp. MB42-C2]WMJ85880.1 VanZ family protein [Anaerocolumna sp. MB42-C2]
MRKIKRVWVWVPTILILFIIYSFSAANGIQSSAMSAGLTDKIIHFFVSVPFLDFNSAQEVISLQVLHLFIRKLGHLTEYAALALSMAFALYKYRVNNRRLISCCMVFGFFYAGTDEIHQLFIIGRSGQFMDVLIDCLGMSAGIIFFYVLIRVCHSISIRMRSSS